MYRHNRKEQKKDENADARRVDLADAAVDLLPVAGVRDGGVQLRTSPGKVYRAGTGVRAVGMGYIYAAGKEKEKEK